MTSSVLEATEGQKEDNEDRSLGIPDVSDAEYKIIKQKAKDRIGSVLWSRFWPFAAVKSRLSR